MIRPWGENGEEPINTRLLQYAIAFCLQAASGLARICLSSYALNVSKALLADAALR